jgi:RimJ/RimL family protein N-acetyltransferase
MPGPVFLRGEAVDLHVVSEADHPFLARNWNDPTVRPGFGGATVMDEQAVTEHVEGLAEGDEGEIFLACADGDPVGEGFLFDLDPQRDRVELGYWIAPDAQGQGYATETAELLVEYAFAERRLNRVVARVLAFNDGSRRVLENVGFEHAGRFREDYCPSGSSTRSSTQSMARRTSSGSVPVTFTRPGVPCRAG